MIRPARCHLLADGIPVNILFTRQYLEINPKASAQGSERDSGNREEPERRDNIQLVLKMGLMLTTCWERCPPIHGAKTLQTCPETSKLQTWCCAMRTTGRSRWVGCLRRNHKLLHTARNPFWFAVCIRQRAARSVIAAGRTLQDGHRG